MIGIPEERRCHTAFPDECLRGLTAKGMINKDGVVIAAAFNDFQSSSTRVDMMELSIAWNDEDEALEVTRAQKRPRDGKLKFPGGLAVLPRQALDAAIDSGGAMAELDYERAALVTNFYHGNLLYPRTMEKSSRDIVVAILAHIARPKCGPPENSSAA